MTVYFSIYLILGLAIFYCKYIQLKDEDLSKAICFIGFNCLFLMFALRHPSMGHDLRYMESYGYLGGFDFISNVDWSRILKITLRNYETGYIVFNKLVSIFSKERQFFMGACAFFSLLPVFYIIREKSVSPTQSIIIYMGLPVFQITYSGLRQALAIGLCFLSINYIQNKKLVKFILLILLAKTLHSSSIIFLCAYPLYYLRLTQARRWMTVALIPLVYVLRRPLFIVFSKIFKDNAAISNTGAFTLFFVFTLVYIFCILYSNGSEEQTGLLNLFLMACICQAFGGVYHVAMRVGYYFMISLVLLLPLVLKDMDEKTDKPIFSAIITTCFALFGLYSIYTSTWACAYPYIFFWRAL